MKRLLQKLGLRKRDMVMPEAKRYTIQVSSTLDRAQQPCVFVPGPSSEPSGLLVYLHPWRHGFDFDSRPWQAEAARRGWHFLQPHFRGPNRRPAACASNLARQDVLDAMDHIRDSRKVDESRIFLAGTSGGGHMALVMAAEAPDRWAAVSAWCPVSDLITWHRESIEVGAKVHRHIEKIVGGPPGASDAVDRELLYRSPRYHMAKAAGVPLDINHGIHDRTDKGIGIQHSVWAFNALAEAVGAPGVDKTELETLQRAEALEEAAEQDPSYGRAIYLRRNAGAARLTIYDGGHEDVPAAAVAWLDQARPKRAS